MGWIWMIAISLHKKAPCADNASCKVQSAYVFSETSGQCCTDQWALVNIDIPSGQSFANPSVVRDRRREFRSCTMRMLEGL